MDGSIADTADLITTTARRTFPKGQNVELIRTSTLLSLPQSELMPSDREHVTAFLHRHPERFHIVNVESGDPKLADESVVVDTLEDLRRLESLDEDDIARLCGGRN
jgi:spore coat polysaccharide biosynthesis protein SpsF